MTAMTDHTPADKPDLPECTCPAKDMPFGRCCKTTPVQTPIAVVGSVYTLHWAGAGPIAPLIERYGIKVGDGLYCARQVQQLLADERRKARAELIAELRAKPVYWYDPDTPLAIVPEK